MPRPRLPLLLAAGVLSPLVALGPGPQQLPVDRAAQAAESPTSPTSPASPSVSPPTSTADATPSPAEPDTRRGSQKELPPLEVRIETVRPAVVPRQAPLQVTGTVVNRSESTWTELRTYLAVSPVPITTPAELAAAQQAPPGTEEAEFQRIVEPGLIADLPDLGPGEEAGFRLVVPRAELGLPETAGVYRIGVHALGTQAGVGRVDGADGRARTFLAQVPEGTRRGAPADDTADDTADDPVPLAVVMQLRNHVVRAPSGELLFERGWRQVLAPDGRLTRLLGLSGTTAGFPLSWLLDGAVVEAAGTMAEGNRSADLGGPAYDGVADPETGGTDGDPGAEPTEEPTASEDASEDPSADAEDGDGESPSGSAEPEPEGVADARAWLEELRSQAPRHPVFSVPYGDLDVAAAARRADSSVVDRAVRTGVDTLTTYGVAARSVVAPLNGALKGWMVDRVPSGVPVLLSADTAPETDRVVHSRGDRPVVLYPPRLLSPDADAGAATGFDETDSTALGMRQRLLAVTAVRSISGDTRPLVALLPPGWDPGGAWRTSAFFAGLDVPWIAATGLGDVAAPASGGPGVSVAPELDDADFTYARAQRRAELRGRVLRHVRRATHAGELLDETLVDDDATGPRLGRQALLAASFHSRRHPRPADARLTGIEERVSSWLRRIRVAAPPFVISSSEEGSFLVPVTNELDQRVRVGLRATVLGPGLEVIAPEVTELPPRTRRPFRMEIRSTGIGVHSVDLDLVSGSGEELYAGPSVPVRSSRVGLVVWVVMAVAGTVFFAAIAVRIVRRIGRRRRTHGPVLRREA